MKRFITLAIIALFLGNVAQATEETTNSDAQKTTITIKANKATKALVETWAREYMQNHSDVDIVVTSKQSATADLSYIINKEEGQDAAFVGRYAILPVTSTQNPLINELQQKEWNKSDLKKLYFASLDEDLDEDDEANRGKAGKLREKLTVYSGANASSVAGVFAEHFGFQPAELRGNKISGDDLYLLNAIDEDKQSITFNNVAYLYDTNSRQLKQNITILPLKVNGEIEETLQKGNLDATLKILEEEKSELIPVENFGFTYNKLNLKAQLFLEWVVSEGQQYNNQNGFLKLAQEDVKEAIQHLAQK